MKNMKSIAFLIICICVFTINTSSLAQNYVAPEVTISKEKIKVDGKVCYSHIVLERQTLYSISKAYGVSLEELYQYNPNLKTEGLKKNSILIIPSNADKQDKLEKQQDKIDKSDNKNDRDQKSDKFDKNNKDNNTDNNKNQAQQKYIVQSSEQTQQKHVVKWYEDIYSIAEKYGVSVEAIMSINKLSDKTLNTRQILIIPDSNYVAVPAIAEGMPQDIDIIDKKIVPDSTLVVASEEESLVDYTKLINPKNNIKIALVLPLKTKSGKRNNNNFDFYSGSLLAIRDLGLEGLNVNLDVFDIATTDINTFGRNKFSTYDLVVGPISASDISKLYTATDSSMSVVSPLDPKVAELTNTFPNLIQAPSSIEAQYQDLISWVKEDCKWDDNVLVISEKAMQEFNPNNKAFAQIIADSQIEYNSLSYSILDGRKIIDNIRPKLSLNGTTRVVINSESEAFVNDVIRNLNLLIHEKFKIVLYSTSKIRSYDTIEVENLHNTMAHVSLPYYIDYNDLKVMNFVKQYRALFKTEPTNFAFQGYDIISYFGRFCATYGITWRHHLNEERKDMLQTSFSMSGDKMQQNCAIRRIVYGPDYIVEMVK